MCIVHILPVHIHVDCLKFYKVESALMFVISVLFSGHQHELSSTSSIGKPHWVTGKEWVE